jgi:hypothetical protein
MRCVGYAASLGEKRNAQTFLVRKPEGKKPLGRSRSRRKNNTNDVKEIG